MAEPSMTEIVALFGKAIEKIISLNENVLEILEDQQKGKNPNMFNPMAVEPRRVVEKPKPVIVQEFALPAMLQLQKLFKSKAQAVGQQKGGSAQQMGWNLAKLLGPAFLGLGAAAAFFESLSNDPRMIGLLQAIAKHGITGGAKVLAKTVGQLFPVKLLAQGFKTVWGILEKVADGFVGGMKTAVNLFSDGAKKATKLVVTTGSKISGAIMKMAKGISDKILGMSDTLTKALAKVTSSVSAVKNVITAAFKPLTNVAIKASKVAGQMFSGLTGMLKKAIGVGAKTGVAALKVLKPIPGIGLLVSLYFAKQDYDRGDWAGVLLNIGSGLASLIPGVGTAVSIAIDILDVIRRFVYTPDTEGEAPPGTSFSFPDFFDKISNWMRDTWLGKQFIGLKTGMSKLFGGDIVGGLVELGNTSLFPIFWPLKPLATIFEAASSQYQQEVPGATEQDIFGIINKRIKNTWMGKQMTLLWNGFKKVFGGNFVDGMREISEMSPIFFPLWALSNIVTAFADSPIPAAVDAGAMKVKDFWATSKAWLANYMRSGWKNLSKGWRWAFKQVMPDSLIAKLEGGAPIDEIDPLNIGTELEETVAARNKKRIAEVENLQNTVSKDVVDMKKSNEEKQQAIIKQQQDSTKDIVKAIKETGEKQNVLMEKQVNLQRENNKEVANVKESVKESGDKASNNAVVNSTTNVSSPRSDNASLRQLRSLYAAAI